MAVATRTVYVRVPVKLFTSAKTVCNHHQISMTQLIICYFEFLKSVHRCKRKVLSAKSGKEFSDAFTLHIRRMGQGVELSKNRKDGESLPAGRKTVSKLADAEGVELDQES